MSTTGSSSVTGGAATTGDVEASPSAMPSSEPSYQPSPSPQGTSESMSTTAGSKMTLTSLTAPDAISDDIPIITTTENKRVQNLIVVVVVSVGGSMMLAAALAVCLVMKKRRSKPKPAVVEEVKEMDKWKEFEENKDLKSISCSRRSSQEALGQS